MTSALFLLCHLFCRVPREKGILRELVTGAPCGELEAVLSLLERVEQQRVEMEQKFRKKSAAQKIYYENQKSYVEER